MILRPPPIGWKPHPGSQVRFLSCPVFECLLEGTRGGGKTDALLMSFVQFVGRGFGAAWRGILFREEYPQLEDVVAKSKKWFARLFPGAKFNESDYVWVFPEGERLYFRHGRREDDYWKYHGHEYPAILFEELTNWRDLGFYEMMQSCCRSSHPGMPRMIRATCNPYGRGHAAVKERFAISDDPRENEMRVIKDAQGRERTYVHSDIHENDTLLAADPQYLASLEGTKDPNRRKAWLLGRWDINIGAFLEGAWDPAKHIVAPFRIPSHWKVWMAMDWGFGRPYAVLWFAKDPEGKTYIWRELYGVAKSEDGKVLPNVGTKESPKTVAERIVAREAHDERLGIEVDLRLTGPDLFARGGAQYGTQITHASTFRENGVAFRPWWAGPGSRRAGSMLVRQMFEEDQLRVFSSCEHFIRTVPTLPPDENDPDDVSNEDDDEDHIWDALKAGCMRRTSTPDEPQKPDEGGAVVLADGMHVLPNAARPRKG